MMQTPSWKISPSLSRLVIYCKSVKFSSFDDPQNNVDQISSFPEGKSKRYVMFTNTKNKDLQLIAL